MPKTYIAICTDDYSMHRAASGDVDTFVRNIMVKGLSNAIFEAACPGYTSIPENQWGMKAMPHGPLFYLWLTLLEKDGGETRAAAYFYWSNWLKGLVDEA